MVWGVFYIQGVYFNIDSGICSSILAQTKIAFIAIYIEFEIAFIAIYEIVY